MKITKTQLRRIIKEAQWGNFTGGAAPLDMPMRDSGPVPKDQLRKMADIFMNDMGMSPEEVLEKPEFAEQGITDLKQLEENKMKVTKRHLQQIIKEEVQKLNEGPSRVAGLKDLFIEFGVHRKDHKLLKDMVESWYQNEGGFYHGPEQDAQMRFEDQMGKDVFTDLMVRGSKLYAAAWRKWDARQFDLNKYR